MLTVSYDGTNYCGWQWQPNGITIEEVLNRELSRLLREEIHIRGTSRTDSGVHALGNLCIFDTETRIPPEKICYAINQSLPEDIVVQDSREVPPDFHPRKWDSEKTYEYTMVCSRFPNPLMRRYAYFLHQKVDVTLMRKAAEYLVGEHDFASFCTPRTQVETTVRCIHRLELKEDGDTITLRITGSGFLYNMVRIITGTLLEVGKGRIPPEQMKDILQARNRSTAGPTAPPQGLRLVEIKLLNPPF